MIQHNIVETIASVFFYFIPKKFFVLQSKKIVVARYDLTPCLSMLRHSPLDEGKVHREIECSDVVRP